MSAKKIIVVGAGPGGLTAAMLLASRGFRVTVFEKEKDVGGRNAPLRLGDYTFDTGPTFLMMKFLLDEMFEGAGRKSEDYLDFRRLDPLYTLSFFDLDIQLPSDRQRTEEIIRDKFPGNEGALDRFLDDEEKAFKVFAPILRKPYLYPWSYLRSEMLRAAPYLSHIRTSLFDILGRYFKDERLKLAFTFQSKYLGMSPTECPGFFAIIPYLEHEHGIFHVIGGLNRISEAMAKVVREAGGEIQTGRPVKQLLLRDRAVTGVALEDGEKIAADEVVINADFAYSMTRLVPPGVLRRHAAERLARWPFSCSAFMLYLGVDKKYDLTHHSIYFARDYWQNIDDIMEKGVLSDDMSFYIQNAGVTDPGLAPEGKSTIYVLVPVANNRSGINWEKEAPVYREKVLGKIAERTPMKDLIDHIEEERVITPREWEDDYNVYIAAIFNLAHNFSQMLYLRPRNRFEELKNCYLAGGGTHPGSGLPTIYESGRITADLISRKHGVRPVAGGRE